MTSVIRILETAMATVMASPLGAVAQELTVLSVFFLSYSLWRCLGQRRQNLRATRKLVSIPRHQHQGGDFGPDGEFCSLGSCRSSALDEAGKLAEAQMMRHLEQREFTLALNLYRTLERDSRVLQFSQEFYLAFIQSAARVGKTDVVERLLRAMKRSGTTPSAAFWQTVLRMLSVRKHFHVCLSVHSVYSRQLPADKIVFSCLINAALEVGVPERTAGMLDRYAETQLDIKDYVLFFRTYAALKDANAAEAMLRKLGSKATTLMLNLTLLSCVSSGQPERGLELLQVAHGFQEEGVIVVDVVSYNTVIKGLAQEGSTSSCFQCLHEMMSRSIQPDDITFATLLDVCVGEEKEAGCAIRKVATILMDSDRPLSPAICTLVIKGLVKANCLPKALELCSEMRHRAGTGPDIITYSVLIKALVDQHELERALTVVEEMRRAGLAPDDIILTHLLEGCRHAGNHVLGKKLFAQMLDSGVKPSEFTLVTMLKLLGRVGLHREAHDLAAGWQAAHKQKPSIIHYTCLMSGCLRSKDYDRAWAAYELMRSNEVKPDSMALSTLLPGMVAAQQWNKVMVLAQEALSDPLKRSAIPGEALNSARAQMQGAGGLGRHVEQLGDLMRAANVPITARAARRRPL